MLTELKLIDATTLEAGGKRYACRIGRSGVSEEKVEGDLKTPAGCFPMRKLYYRPDRLKLPETLLPVTALTPIDGWCDDASDPRYNQPVMTPYVARYENLWREDHIYDLIVPLGYNDEPVIPGKGSAIFMHLMRPDGVGTEGCIALKEEDLLELLKQCSTETQVVIPAL